MKMEASRDGYGQGLLAIGEDKKVIALDADLSCSTRSAKFGAKWPERFINVGIAEQNLMGIAAGLAATGKIPFASTFAMFILRGFEQIRNSICYSNLNVKICGSHGGLATGEDGATHQAIEDMSVLRSIPNMTVICPADSMEAKKATIAAYEHIGPVYIRTTRAKTPVVFDEDYDFKIGKGSVVKDGKDISLIATGSMLYEAMQASEKLEKDGFSVRVINMATIKPIDAELIAECANETGAIITCEDHSIIGGLGSAVAEILAGNTDLPFSRIGVKDTFGESGAPADLKKKYGIDADHIIEEAKRLLEVE
jgi:transketolase